MAGFFLPDIPEVYWINMFTYKCKNCSNEFEYFLPNGNELVKYSEINGSEIRWLPSYGRFGYLDLLSKLRGFNIKDEITVKLAKEFEDKLKEYMEPSRNGNLFSISYKPICTNCIKSDLILVKKTVLKSPKVEWLKLSNDLLR
jgi:hypothetical protein